MCFISFSFDGCISSLYIEGNTLYSQARTSRYFLEIPVAFSLFSTLWLNLLLKSLCVFFFPTLMRFNTQCLESQYWMRSWFNPRRGWNFRQCMRLLSIQHRVLFLELLNFNVNYRLERSTRALDNLANFTSLHFYADLSIVRPIVMRKALTIGLLG